MPDAPRSSPPRGAPGLLLGILAGASSWIVALQTWRYFFASPVQAHYIDKYAKYSLFGALKPHGMTHYLALWLGANVYHGHPVTQVLHWPIVAFAICFPACVIAGIAFDLHRRNRARAGVRLAGPFLVSRWQFNRRVKGRGTFLTLDNRRNLLEWLPWSRGKRLHLPSGDVAAHIEVIGDPRQGKTLAIRQILDQVVATGGAAVVYDPHQELLPLYFDAARGDMILNPLDARCPFWSPTAELDLTDKATAEAQALSMAVSLYPGKETDKDYFFTDCSRKLLAYLLVDWQPATARELGNWLEHPDPEIDQRVKGTEIEHWLDKNSAPQRNGIVATASRVAFSLRQMPDAPRVKATPPGGLTHIYHDPFAVREWVTKRSRWLFLTSSPDTREALKPIQSLWLDMLIVRLLSMGHCPDLSQVTMVLDELPTLQQLPKLESALTESAKTGLRIVLGFQGQSQMRALYGEVAEAIISAPAAKVFFKTSEPNASDWMSRAIGDVKVDQLEETMPAHLLNVRGAHTQRMQQRTERLFLASEIAGLSSRNGLLRYGNYVVRVQIPIPGNIEARVPAFVPRKGSPAVKRELPSQRIQELRAAVGLPAVPATTATQDSVQPRTRMNYPSKRSAEVKTP